MTVSRVVPTAATRDRCVHRAPKGAGIPVGRNSEPPGVPGRGRTDGGPRGGGSRDRAGGSARPGTTGSRSQGSLSVSALGKRQHGNKMAGKGWDCHGQPRGAARPAPAAPGGARGARSGTGSEARAPPGMCRCSPAPLGWAPVQPQLQKMAARRSPLNPAGGGGGTARKRRHGPPRRPRPPVPAVGGEGAVRSPRDGRSGAGSPYGASRPSLTCGGAGAREARAGRGGGQLSHAGGPKAHRSLPLPGCGRSTLR